MDCDEVLIPIDNSLVVLEGAEGEVDIAGMHLYYREGAWYERGDDGEFYPDWGLTWFYKNPEHPEDYFYYEQDAPVVAIHNLISALSRD